MSLNNSWIQLSVSMADMAETFERLGEAFKQLIINPIATVVFMGLEAERRQFHLWTVVRYGEHWLLVIKLPGIHWGYRDGLVGWEKNWVSIGRIMNRPFFQSVWAWHGQPEESFTWTP